MSTVMKTVKLEGLSIATPTYLKEKKKVGRMWAIP